MPLTELDSDQPHYVCILFFVIFYFLLTCNRLSVAPVSLLALVELLHQIMSYNGIVCQS